MVVQDLIIMQQEHFVENSIIKMVLKKMEKEKKKKFVLVLMEKTIVDQILTESPIWE